MHGTIKSQIDTIAAKYYKQADGIVLDATEIMTHKVLADHKLYRALMDPLVREAVYNIMTRFCRTQRRIIEDQTQPSAKQSRKGIEALAKGTMSSYFKWPLPGGVLLGNATKAEVKAASEFYLKPTTDMLIKGRWLALIDERMQKDQIVQDVFTGKQLAKLREKAEQSV